MIIIGLTGGIASGKSTVARMFADMGAHILDADQLARDVVEPGQPALAHIVDAFGPEILSEAGELDRRAMRTHIFFDPERRRKLNAIVHPAVMDEALRRFEAERQAGTAVLLFEAALIVDIGIAGLFDVLVVADCSPAEQRRRLLARDGVEADEAERTLAAQADPVLRRAAADYVVSTEGSLEATRAQVRRIWAELTDKGDG